MGIVTPAQVLISSLLVGGHEVHELQAGALVLRAQEGAAVGVDAAHPLQRLEEGLSNLGPLQAHAHAALMTRLQIRTMYSMRQPGSCHAQLVYERHIALWMLCSRPAHHICASAWPTDTFTSPHLTTYFLQWGPLTPEHAHVASRISAPTFCSWGPDENFVAGGRES